MSEPRTVWEDFGWVGCVFIALFLGAVFLMFAAGWAVFTNLLGAP